MAAEEKQEWWAHNTSHFLWHTKFYICPLSVFILDWQAATGKPFNVFASLLRTYSQAFSLDPTCTIQFTEELTYLLCWREKYKWEQMLLSSLNGSGGKKICGHIHTKFKNVLVLGNKKKNQHKLTWKEIDSVFEYKMCNNCVGRIRRVIIWQNCVITDKNINESLVRNQHNLWM